MKGKALRWLLIFLLCAFAALAIANASRSVSAAAEAIRLWGTAVVPALLPFFIASQALLLMGFAAPCARVLAPLMRFLGYAPQGAYALAVSMLGGYPGGARAVAELCARGEVSPQEGARLALFCHTSGPLFVLGTAASAILHRPEWGAGLLLCHYGACFCTASVLSLRTQPDTRAKKPQQQEPMRSFGAVMGQSVTAGVNTMLLICGYMVFFGVVISMLPMPKGNGGAVLTGMLEMTSGLARLQGEAIFPIACAMISFSGLCINLQALSFLQGVCSPAAFFGARLLCGALALGLGIIAVQSGSLLCVTVCVAGWTVACRLLRKLFA